MNNNDSKKNNEMDEDSVTKIDEDESSETVINQNLYNLSSIHKENQENNTTYRYFQSQNGPNHINQTMVNNRLPNQDGLREPQPRRRLIDINGTNVPFQYVIHRSPLNIPEQVILSRDLFDNVVNGRMKIVISANQEGIINQQPQNRISFKVYRIQQLPRLSQLPPPTRPISNRIPILINGTNNNTVNPNINHNGNNNTNTTNNNQGTNINQVSNNKQNNTK